MNISLQGTITLRSSLAHGAFENGATVMPFRREPILQRNPDGSIMMNPYRTISDPLAREQLRQYAQRLLRICWQSRSKNASWTYAQLSDRIGVSARMKSNLGSMIAEIISKLGGGSQPVFFDDDSEFFTNTLAASDANLIIALLRDPGERMLIVARMQAESAARHEKRALPVYANGQLSLFAQPDEERPASVALFADSETPYIPLVPVYSANALRNGVVRRHAARFILDRFGWKLPMESFRCLFSAGALMRTGEKGTDIDARRKLIALMPLYGLLGGPLNTNSMIEGSCKPSKAFPLVAEARPVLPAWRRDRAGILSMESIINTEVYSRRVDAALLAGDYINQRVVIGGEGEDSAAGGGMVFEREVLMAGTQLHSEWNFYQTTPMQIGAWLSAWEAWSQRPILGGASQHGHGLADVEYRLAGSDLDAPAWISIIDGDGIEMSGCARQMLDAYKQHLDDNNVSLKALLQATETVSDAPAEIPTNIQAEMETQEMD